MSNPAVVKVHDLNDGCTEDSGEHWRDLYEAMSREATKQRDQVMRQQGVDLRRERDAYAATLRRVWDDVLFDINGRFGKATIAPLSRLAYQLEHLPEKLRTQDLFFVRDAARDIQAHLDKWSAAAEESSPLIGKVRRLRTAMRRQGAVLHAQHGPLYDRDGHCRCPGCEMTRAVEVDGATDG